MNAKTLNKLLKTLKRSQTYKEFEERVLKFLRWYDLPNTWTKSDLDKFYFSHGGR